MTFTGLELTAIGKMAKLMVFADGIVNKEEVAVMTRELLRFGVTIDQAQAISEGADAMSEADAISIISSMTSEEKRYVSAYLGVIMAIDGDIDENELKVWRIISTICKLPTMSILEAVNHLAKL